MYEDTNDIFSNEGVPEGNNIHGYYHVKIVSGNKEELYEFDLTENHLTENIVKPYKSGSPFYFSGQFVDPFGINIRISQTEKPVGSFSEAVEKYRMFQDEENVRRYGFTQTDVYQSYLNFSKLEQSLKKNDVTTKFIQFPPIKGQTTEVEHQSGSVNVSERYDPKKIFIVHGHDNTSKVELSNFLFRRGMRPIILHEELDEGITTIIQKFQTYAEKVGYAFVLLTPDDVGTSMNEITSDPKATKLNPRARQNVILELGYFIGKLGLDRVCVMTKKRDKKEEEVEPPSDMGGVLFLKYTNSVTEKDFDIVKRLTKAGYKLDI
jgi:predicted nucleotide-binding protein